MIRWSKDSCRSLIRSQNMAPRDYFNAYLLRERRKQTQRQRETVSCIDGHRKMCFFSSFLSHVLRFLFVPTYRWLISTKCCLHFFEPIPHRQCKWAESSASFLQHHANVRDSSSYWRGWRRMAYVFDFIATIVHTCFIQIPHNPFQPALHISRIWSFYTNVQWVWFIWNELCQWRLDSKVLQIQIEVAEMVWHRLRAGMTLMVSLFVSLYFTVW